MRAAFTLIELMAAVFLTAVVMTVAITFFVSLSDSTDAAAQKARQGRQALAVLDRVARDLEGAYLLAKPPRLDPLRHPWIFVAESRVGDSASDRVQFVTRNHRPRNPFDHGSDLAVVTYLLHPAEEGPGFDLLRAVAPGLPADQDSEFPSASDERFMVMAQRVDHFGLRFMSTDFEWYDAWDSTQLEQSAALPRAAEISIAYLPELPPDADIFDDLSRIDLEEGETPVYTHRIRLPMQAVNLDGMLSVVQGEAAALEAVEGEEDFEDDDLDLPEGLEIDVDTPPGFDPGELEITR